MPPETILTRSIMSSPVQTIALTAGALEAAEQMQHKQVLHLVVVDLKGHIRGVLSDRDLRSAQPSILLVPDDQMRRKALALLKVEHIMTRDPFAVHDDDPVDRALNEMLRRRLGCLPVVDRRGTLVGIVTPGDVTKLALSLVRADATTRANDRSP